MSDIESPLRVLHVLYELMPSGMERMLHCTFDLWHEHAITPILLATGPTVGIFADELTRIGYQVLHLPFATDRHQRQAFRKLLIDQRIDVLHIHTERGVQLMVWDARRAGVKTIVKTHHSIFKYSGMLRLRRAFERWFCARLGCRFISLGKSVQDNERHLYSSPSVVIPNWFDERRFPARTESDYASARTRLNMAPDVFCVVTVGNCSTIKNHELLLEALVLLPQHVNWRYLHIGKERSPEPERALAQNLGIAERVSFLGPQSNPEDYILGCDVHVTTSLLEGFGIAAVEAMSIGCMVCLTDVPGLRDFSTAIPGLVYTPLNAQVLAEKLTALAQMSPAARHEIGHNLHQSVQVFSRCVGVSKYVQQYRA
ncbi:MAG: glycosyltransferase [Phycisphaerae bacterium]